MLGDRHPRDSTNTWPLGERRLEAPASNPSRSEVPRLLLKNRVDLGLPNRAGLAMDRESWFFGKLLGITIGLAVIAVALAVSQYCAIR
jgi:hypothetical protein